MHPARSVSNRSPLAAAALLAMVAAGCNRQPAAENPDGDGTLPDLTMPHGRPDLSLPPVDGGAPDAGGGSDGGTVTLERVALCGGTYHTCAILPSGQVKCWGWNEAGQLGLGDRIQRGQLAGQHVSDFPAVQLGTGRSAVSLVAGWYHTCAILDNDTLKCWGSNVDGQSGLGQPTDFGDEPGEMGDALPAVDLGTGRHARQLAAGESFTCALLDDATVKCWGDNSYGNLGLGDKNKRGDSAGEMGDALPAVSLGTGRSARQIAVARHHACALLDNGQVKCWGRNLGQLGLGDTRDRGDDPGEMGDALPAADLGTGRTAIAIAAGENHTCAILDNQKLKCWGTNYYGELGLGDAVYRGDGPGEMGDALPAVSLGTGRTPKRVLASDSLTCVLLDDATVKCWGTNIVGELGRGDQESYGNKAGQMGDALAPISLGRGRTVRTLYPGYDHRCALLDDGSLKCWGWNMWGQLGLGDTNTRGDGPGEMGDALPVLVLGP